MKERLVWAEINLKNFSFNFFQIRKLLGTRVKIMAVVKANAYGHGSVAIAKQAARLGADYLGVVCLYEARILRESGNKLSILILNYIDGSSISHALDLDLTLNVMDEKVAKELDKLARKLGKKAKIHVKIDTGMHRLGLLPDQALRFIPKLENYKNIALEGIFTHFATADGKNLDFTYYQLTVFNELLSKLFKKGIKPSLIHSANSAASLRIKSSHFNMIRPGIILYGLPPSNDFKLPFKPKPILTLKTKIVQLRKISKGETVGYGRTFKATSDTLVATIPVGYADGFRRAPTNWGSVLVKGQRTKVLGRVSMDQSSIDVTKIPNIEIDDEVVLIGKHGQNEITANDVARNLGTINYEVVSSLSSRVSRVYNYD